MVVVVVLCVAETYCRGCQLQCGQLPELELSHGNQPKGPVTTSSPEEVDFETNMWHNTKSRSWDKLETGPLGHDLQIYNDLRCRYTAGGAEAWTWLIVMVQPAIPILGLNALFPDYGDI
ncbi:uncharacterized protein BO87DRAFT_416603 [Aspergillus neoniger CBS 115656]|uniref:Uncharacterized protein n=1 Tax=Aspergillus neoniger (strain CBS 115656) TaxID=1448310 RepID=A0A318Z0G1_ASPNB|nr:hypothetical protein BO87DRAFT_416603 [Aspergillus neoniger CBS 115656]PYH33598.1 hypothetical protein BO87DRAFT_416603 [Aspergillus neoniger CBS 115656]